MTAVLDRPAGAPAWNSMPGWGIVGDLTPPELIDARRLQFLRRLIAGALALVVVLCAAGYAYAMVKHSGASDDLDAASTRSTELQASVNKYNGITRIETSVKAIQAQIGSAMTDDVDVAALVKNIRAALPNTMSLANLSLTLTQQAGATTSTSSASSLNTTGHLPIGNVTVTGSGQHLSDLAGYVVRLSALKGVTDVVPTSNQLSNKTTQFSVSLTITDALYSHDFDVKGGK